MSLSRTYIPASLSPGSPRSSRIRSGPDTSGFGMLPLHLPGLPGVSRKGLSNAPESTTQAPFTNPRQMLRSVC